MGSFWISEDDMLEGLIDFSASRTGLILPRDKVKVVVEERLEKFESPVCKIRFDEWTDCSEYLLKNVIGVNPASMINPMIRMFETYIEDSEIFVQYLKYIDEIAACAEETEFWKRFDKLPEKFALIHAQFLAYSIEYWFYQIDYLHNQHRVSSLAIPLSDLWESEKLPRSNDSLIEQVYINYLAKNTDDLYRINWRKFEALTAEYFKRKGYKVELGPGRKDGGIDVFATKDGYNNQVPEKLIIQCKRLGKGNTVQINDVKALYYDLIEHGASQAVIITTSNLSRAGENIIGSGHFPITYMDHERVVKIIKSMCSFDYEKSPLTNRTRWSDKYDFEFFLEYHWIVGFIGDRLKHLKN